MEEWMKKILKSLSRTKSLAFSIVFILFSCNLLAETLQIHTFENNESPLRIAIISDMNGDYGSPEYSIRVHKAVEKLRDLKPDAILVTGDMVSGEKKGLDYKAMWKGFRDTVTLPLTQSNIPILVTPGNHDASGWSGFENERKIYKDEWTTYYNDYLSKNQSIKLISMENFPFHYSFSIKDVFFMSIDATTQLELSSSQKLWLENQSRAATNFKHKVVFSHYPMHPIAIQREKDFIADKNNTVFKMLKSNGVNLFLSGHQHAYYPSMWEGVRFVSQACLGGGPRKYIGTSKLSEYAFTMVDFLDEIRVDAFSYPNFTSPIDRKSLPASFKTPKGGNLIRDDLALKKNYKIETLYR